MTTRADLRSRVRTELNDIAVGNYLYADGLLNGYIGEALSDWSDHNPALTRGIIAPVAGQRAYILPAGILNILSLEQPEGAVLEAGRIEHQRDNTATAIVTRSFKQAWGYDVFSRTLWLRYPAAAGEANLVYTATLAYLNPTDDVTALDLAVADEPAIVWFGCARALQWLHTQREKRGDSSRLALANLYENRYRQAVARAKQRKGIVTNQLKQQV